MVAPAHPAPPDAHPLPTGPATGEDGWAVLAQVGSYIVNNHPSFDSRNYGHPRLGPLMREMPGVEVKERPMGDGATQLWVRRAAR